MRNGVFYAVPPEAVDTLEKHLLGLGFEVVSVDQEPSPLRLVRRPNDTITVAQSKRLD